MNPPRHLSKSLKNPDFFNCLIRAGRLKRAVESLILRRHLGDSLLPDTFAAVFRSIVFSQTLIHGRQLHAHMVVTDFNHDALVQNHLIGMYGKCGCLDDAYWVFRLMERKKLHSWNTLIDCYCKAGSLREARQLFDEMPQRDSVSWNTMIAGCDRSGKCEMALEIFVGMRRSVCRVDHFGVSSAISACSNLRFLNNGKEIHGLSKKIGLDSQVQVGSALTELYAKCGAIVDARKVLDGMHVKEQFTWNSMLAGHVQFSRTDEALKFFQEMPEKDVVSWTTLIAGFSQRGKNVEAIELFYKMLEAGLRPDQVCFVSVLNASVQMLEIEEGLKIHSQIVKFGLKADAIVGSVLVTLYAKSGHFDIARSVIGAMDYADDFSWSTLIAEYANHGLAESARELFECLEMRSLPLWNALIGGYSGLGLDEEAFQFFKKMQMDGINGDEFTFGSLLLGTKAFGHNYGTQLHSQTIKLGVNSSASVGSALINMYSNNLECEATILIFDAIHEPNLVAWNAMISGYGGNDMDREALHAFQLMMDMGMEPDNITLSLILDSCSNLLSFPVGMQVHAIAYKLCFESDVVVGSAIIDMYGKCENMDAASQAFSDIHAHNVFSWTALLGGYVRCRIWDTAEDIFNRMPAKNVVSWNTIISGHAKHGSGLEALKLYSQMTESGQLPDHISFVSLLMVCCNYALEELAKQVHAQIIKTGYHKNSHIKTLLSDIYQKLGDPQVISNRCSRSNHLEDTAVVAEVDAV